MEDSSQAANSFRPHIRRLSTATVEYTDRTRMPVCIASTRRPQVVLLKGY